MIIWNGYNEKKSLCLHVPTTAPHSSASVCLGGVFGDRLLGDLHVRCALWICQHHTGYPGTNNATENNKHY